MIKAGFDVENLNASIQEYKIVMSNSNSSES
jgi:hypothetical protein